MGEKYVPQIKYVVDNTMPRIDIYKVELPDTLREKGELRFVLISDITLFSNRYRFQKNDGERKNTKSQMYNKVFILEKGGKLYGWNEYGDKVFLPKGGIYASGEISMHFSQIDGTLVSCVEYDGANAYYDQQGNYYKPKTLSEKLVTSISNQVETSDNKLEEMVGAFSYELYVLTKPFDYLSPLGKGIVKISEPVITSLLNILDISSILSYEKPSKKTSLKPSDAPYKIG